MRWSSQKERSASKTGEVASVALKTTIARFFNTTLLIVVMHVVFMTSDPEDANEWLNKGFFFSDVYGLMIGMALFDPIVFVGNPGGIVNKLKIWWEKRKGKESMITQVEARALHEGTQVDPADVIAAYMNMIMTCIFFAPVLPLSIPLAMASSFLNYWAIKYVLLRRAKRPDMLGEMMALTFVNLMPYLVFAQTITSILCFIFFSGYNDKFYMSWKKAGAD